MNFLSLKVWYTREMVNREEGRALVEITVGKLTDPRLSGFVLSSLQKNFWFISPRRLTGRKPPVFISNPSREPSAAFIQTRIVLRASAEKRTRPCDTISISSCSRKPCAPTGESFPRNLWPLRPENNNCPCGGCFVRAFVVSHFHAPRTPRILLLVHPPFIFSTSPRLHSAVLLSKFKVHSYLRRVAIFEIYLRNFIRFIIKLVIPVAYLSGHLLSLIACNLWFVKLY